MDKLQEQLERGLAGRYRLERELGQGGMAVVFLAEDLRHDRKVALKVLRPDLSAAIGAERFLREIKLAAGLTHPHILPVYDSGQAGELLFYVMPNMEGRSLRERMQQERQLPLADALAITREASAANCIITGTCMPVRSGITSASTLDRWLASARALAFGR